MVALDAAKAEGDAGTTAFTFTLTRTGDTTIAHGVDFLVSGSGGDAADATDFGGAFPSGTVTFAIGQTSQTLTIDVTGDNTAEPDEGFTVTLSNPSTGAAVGTDTALGSIENEDTELSVFALDADKLEGDSGTTAFTFTLTRTGDTTATNTVDFAVTGNTGLDASDFVGGVLPTGTVSFAAGEISQSVTVNVAGDLLVESDEVFTVRLSNPSGGSTFGTESAIGTIHTDDTPLANAQFTLSTQSAPFGLSDVGFDSAPTFADIDGDGDLDAFVGELYGNVFFFENTGSSTSAAFAAPDSPFGLSDVGFYNTPTFADIDGDGDLDAFVGESAGNLNFFENTGSSTSAAFAAPVTSSPFGLSDVGPISAPTFIDIDGDGDLDAFVGEQDGNLNFFENTGSSTSAAFAAPVTNSSFGLSDVGFYSAPTFIDIDGDGDLDAFVGEFYGNVFFFENTGSSTSAAFAAPVTSSPFGV